MHVKRICIVIHLYSGHEICITMETFKVVALITKDSKQKQTIENITKKEYTYIVYINNQVLLVSFSKHFEKLHNLFLQSELLEKYQNIIIELQKFKICCSNINFVQLSLFISQGDMMKRLKIKLLLSKLKDHISLFIDFRQFISKVLFQQ